ncbi:MAG: 30S ribosomal protein S17 [Pseudomonadota bacterium]
MNMPVEEVTQKRTLVGVVTSDARQNTITVQVNWTARHPKLGKVVRRRTKYQVHDAQELAGRGDVVRIQECRPISKTKHWMLVEVVSQNAQV